MAGRKDKNTVDYFPHYCNAGKTMFILENKFGNNGYTVWFKTLELLGSNENHYLDLRDETDLLFITSKMKIDEIELISIYDLLSKLGAIDKLLWKEKIIYSDNYVSNIADAYKRRNKDVVHKSDLCKHILKINIHEYTKESRVDKSKGEKSIFLLKFDFFFKTYYSKIKKPKEQEEAALQEFEKLTEEEQQKALDNIRLYADTKPHDEHKYLVICKNYLAGKLFNNEFKKKLTRAEQIAEIVKEAERLEKK